MRKGIDNYLKKLKDLLTPSGSLTKQAVASGIWETALNFLGRALQLLMIIILARLLTPREFGIVGVALVIIAGLRSLSRLGLNRALIYNKKENVDGYLNTTWSLNVGRGIVIAAILVMGAPYAAILFNEPSVAKILPVMALGPLLDSAKNPGIVYFKKDLDYHKQFVYDMSASLAQFTIAVGYAMVDPSVWALVVGFLSSSASNFFISYLLHGYRPRPSFNVDLAKELIDYGKWITGVAISGFIRNEGDDAFVGWFLGATSLGFYQISYRFSNAPATEITQVINRVAFPAYSKVQDDPAALRAGFFRSMKIAMFVATPMAVGIAVVAPTFVRAFLGAKWLQAVVPMQIFALFAIWRALGALFGTVWQATGRPDLDTKLLTLRVLLMVLFIYPASKMFGIVGAALTIFGTTLFTIPIDIYFTVKIIDTTFQRIVRQLAYPLVASMIMGAIVYLVQHNLPSELFILHFFVLVFVGIIVYIGTVTVLEVQFHWGLRSEIREIKDAF